MLVIVSPTTMKSNWVPFEIGFGYDKTELSVLTLMFYLIFIDIRQVLVTVFGHILQGRTWHEYR